MLQLLAKLFGKSYLNKIMGTRTNVAKPIRMDNNSPFKEYSNDAFNDLLEPLKFGLFKDCLLYTSDAADE